MLDPQKGWLGHIQSILWYILFLTGLICVYRRTGATSFAAGIALLFCALNGSHSVSVSWIANRHAVMSIAIAIWALFFACQVASRSLFVSRLFCAYRASNESA